MKHIKAAPRVPREEVSFINPHRIMIKTQFTNHVRAFGSPAAMALLALILARPVPAQVILSDNFSRYPTGTKVGTPPQFTAPAPGTWVSSWGANNNYAGGYLTQTYITYTNASAGITYMNDSGRYSGNWLNNGDTAYPLKLNNSSTTITEPIGIPGFAWVQINHNFATNAIVTNATKLRITFDWYRTPGGNINWSFGNNDSTGITNGNAGSPPTIAANDISLYWRGFQANTFGMRDNGVIVNDAISYIGNPNITTQPIPIRIEITRVSGTPFAPGGTSLIELWVDGKQQDLGGTGSPSGYTFTWDEEGGAYMVFGSNNSPISGSAGSEVYLASGIDNLVIAAVPYAPQIYRQPVSRTNAVGSSATFEVGATGDPTPSYQWYFISGGSTNPIPGATASTFTRDPVQLAHAGGYFVIVTNSAGSATSTVATLTVLENIPPFITANPTNVTVAKGQPVTLYVGADGTPPLSYQWRKNGSPVGGATTNPYIISSAAYTDAGNWNVVVTNNFGAVTSGVAVVTVLDVTPPVIANATNITVAPAGPSGTVVNLAHVTATDDKDGSVPVTLNPPSGSLFPPGVTVVTAAATDSSGNTGRVYFNVQVLATIAAQTNFFDNFNVSSANYDINFEYNLSSRQTGLLSPIPYSELARTIYPSAYDYFSTVDGTLTLSPSTGTGVPNFVEATPAREFLESATFTLEVDVSPASGVSDWAGIALGSPYAHVYPNETSTGFGILFRGTGLISVFDGATTVYSGAPDYLTPGGLLPTPPFRVRLVVSGSSFGGGSPATVNAFVNGNPIRLTPTSLTLVKPAGLTNNFIVLSGNATSGMSVHSFDNLVLTALPTIFAWPPELATVVGRSNQTFTVTVPPSLVATSAVSVVISNANPAVAQMVGETGGTLTLNYTLGGPSVKTVTVVGLSAGTTTLTLRNPSVAVPLGGKPVTVRVGGLPEYIYNAGFEEPPIPAFPGYGNLPGWTASDTNWIGISPNLNVGGALANNSVSGHGRNVAFLQNDFAAYAGSQMIGTMITNLTIGKKYQISFLANGQQGAQAAAAMTLFLNGMAVFAADVPAVGASSAGYFPVSVVHTAAATTLSLAVSNNTFTSSGLLLDDFQVRELAPGRWSYAAWTGDGDSGISSTNTYTHAYNLGEAVNVVLNGVTFTGVAGANPAVSNQFTYTAPNVLTGNSQNNLTGSSASLGNAFVYGGTTPKLTLHGLTPGARYRLTLFGAGFGDILNYPTRSITFFGGGESLSVNENQFGRGNGIRVVYDFVAAGASEVIEGRVFSGNNTFHLWAFANQLVAPAPILKITLVSGPQVRIAWPAALSGFTLQSAPNVTGTYTNVGVTPIIEGSERVVYQTPVGGSRFYRLINP